MADKVVSMQQNSDGSFDFSFLFDNGAGITGETDVHVPAPQGTQRSYQRRNYDPDGGCPCGLYATDSISGGAAYRGHTESKLASRSERCSGHRERCQPVDNRAATLRAHC